MRLSLVLVPLALSISCQAPISESGALRLEPNPFSVAWVGDHVEFDGSQPILVGSRFCISYAAEDSSQGVSRFETLSDCYSTTVSGPAPQDASDCVDVTGAGEITLDLTPNPGGEDCADKTLSADRFVLSSVDEAGLTAAFWFGPERYLTTTETQEPVVFGSIPDDLEVTAPYRILADEAVIIPVELFAADGRAVAYANIDGSTVRDDQDNVVAIGSLQPRVTLAAGTYSVEASAITVSVDVGEVQAIPRANLASVEIIAAVIGEPDAPRTRSVVTDDGETAVNADGTTFMGVRAVVRDDEGNVVYGVPVDWTVDEGAVSILGLEPYSKRNLSPEDQEAQSQSDALMLGDLCHPPEARVGARTITLSASAGALTTTRTFELDVGEVSEFSEDDNATWTADDTCAGPDISPRRARIEAPEGCLCRGAHLSAGTGAGTGACLGGGALLALLLRRRALRARR